MMRFAALYDIHGNLPALEAVFHDIRREQVDFIVIGGDVVAGPMPNEVLTLIRSADMPMRYLRGNAESELLRCLTGKEPGGLSERANEEAYWLAQILAPEHKHFVSSWSPVIELQLDEWSSILFCHATPNSNIEIFTRLTPEDELVSIFDRVTASLVVCGHTHMQFDRIIGDVRVVNAGSVGMPFGKTGADWLLLNNGIEFRHTDYDVDRAAERIRESNYPHAEDFAANNVLQTPSEAKALNMLSQLEKWTRSRIISASTADAGRGGPASHQRP